MQLEVKDLEKFYVLFIIYKSAHQSFAYYELSK